MKKDSSVIIEKVNNENLTDFIDLVRLFEIVFEMKDFKMPDSKHLENLLSRSDFEVFVAKSSDKVVGGLTTYVLEQYYCKKPLAYIFDLAVETNLQRQGIGKKLVKVTNDYYKNKGFEEVFVQADRIDDYAVDFYRKTNPSKEEEVLHFYYKLN